MATIAINTATSGLAKAITFTALTGSDSLTATTGMLFVKNDSASLATLVIDGAGGATDFVAGYGRVNTASGYTITVAAGAVGFMALHDIQKYLRGVVAVTGGGAGVFAAVIQ